MSVVCRERNCFSPEPVGLLVLFHKYSTKRCVPITNVVGISIEKSDADTVSENLVEILDEIGVDNITGRSETKRDVTSVGRRIVYIDP